MNDIKKHITFSLLLSFCLSGFAADTGSRQVYIVQLQNQVPETLIPTLKPLLTDGDSISGFNNELVINTSPQRIEAMRQLISKLDKPLRNLLISVKNNNSSSSQENNSGLSGGIRHETIRLGTGQPQNKTDGVNISSEGLTYSAGTTKRTVSTRAEQQIRAIENSPAFISTGESRLYPTTRDAYGNINTTEVNADKGFYVTARLAGDRVILDITVSNDKFDSSSASSAQAAMSTQQLSTSVSGQVGEWISLGGITLNDHNRENTLVKKITTSSGNLGDISVKVTSLSE